MLSAKQEAIGVIAKLPENVNYEDIMYELYVMEKINKGKKDIEEGNYMNLEEVEMESEKW